MPILYDFSKTFFNSEIVQPKFVCIALGFLNNPIQKSSSFITLLCPRKTPCRSRVPARLWDTQLLRKRSLIVYRVTHSSMTQNLSPFFANLTPSSKKGFSQLYIALQRKKKLDDARVFLSSQAKLLQNKDILGLMENWIKVDGNFLHQKLSESF